MTTGMVISNHAVTNSSDRSISRRKRKKKKKKTKDENLLAEKSFSSTIQWKSDAHQQVYSSKLLQAMFQVHGGASTSPKHVRAVHKAADKILVVTAKGRTGWSLAILTIRLTLKFRKRNNNKRQRVTLTENRRWEKKYRVSILRLKAKNLPPVQRKAHVLGWLVPGCWKEPLPVVLEEATNYIAAHEMQVRAMKTLAELLSSVSTSFSSASSRTNKYNRPPPT